jgi:hypothetical protein
VATLEHPRLDARLAEIARKPIELFNRALPETASKAIAVATTQALNTALSAPRYRLILKGQKIREILGGSLGVLDDFPAKPKGMHWRRYNRLRHLHDQAVENSLQRCKDI